MIRTFKISRIVTDCTFLFLGIRIKQFIDKITCDQDLYAEKIKPVLLTAQRKSTANRNDALTTEERKSYQGLLGQLLWLSNQTRPDHSFDAMEMSMHSKSPTVGNLITLNKAVKNVTDGQHQLCFRAMNLEKDRLKIVFYSDASLGNLPNGETGRGYIVFLCNQDGITNVICWSSNKIRRVVKSVLLQKRLVV